MGTTPSVDAQTEAGSERTPGDLPIMAYTEKILEEKEEQLRKYIQENYSKIRDVERELGNLTLELKLTAGPKKAALEHLRKKIELSTEKIRVAKQKEEMARQVWEAAVKALKEEETRKEAICEDLNRLVQESASAQYSRLEDLKSRLEALNPVTKDAIPESVNLKSDGSSPASSEHTTTSKSNLDARKMGSLAPDEKVISTVTSNKQVPWIDIICKVCRYKSLTVLGLLYNLGWNCDFNLHPCLAKLLDSKFTIQSGDAM